jgi:hypothetical protein
MGLIHPTEQLVNHAENRTDGKNADGNAQHSQQSANPVAP